MTIIGIPLATLGLFAVMSQWVRGKQPEFFKVFLGEIRKNWSKALMIGAIDLVAGGILFINLSILRIMEPDDILAMFARSLTLFSSLILVISNVYIWFLIATIDLPLKTLLKLMLIFVFTYPLKSFGITVLVIIPVILTPLLPALFFLFISASTTAYIASRGAWFIVQEHFSVQELEALNLLPTLTKHKDMS